MRHGSAHPPLLIRFSILPGVAEDVKNFAVIYVVDITEVPDFNAMSE